MCRLFGFRSNVPSRTHRSLLVAENAVAQQACKHTDGWGIGYYIGAEPYIFRSALGAAQDTRFQTFGERLRSHTFLVHVRKATVGVIDELNSHPFRFGSWMFAHNGTIFGFDKIRDKILASILPEFHHLIFGNTDSERYFYFLLSHLVEFGCDKTGRRKIDVNLAAEAQRLALSKIFCWAKELGEDPPKANYILTNGTVLFARRAGLELYIATQKTSCPDYQVCKEPNKVCLMGIMPPIKTTLNRPRKCNHLLVASEPIGTENIWEEVPDGSLVSLDDNFMVRVHGAPEPFWVTWPPEVTRHPVRDNVIPA